MDPAYYTWCLVLCIGLVLGLFVRPGTVLKITVVLFVVAVVGLVIAALSSAETLVWVFGMAAMATPVFGAITAAGSLLGSLVRGLVARARK